MNNQIEDLMYRAGLTAQGCWDKFDEYDKQALNKFAELIVRECVQVCADRGKMHDGLYSAWADDCSKRIGKHFGVEE